MTNVIDLFPDTTEAVFIEFPSDAAKRKYDGIREETAYECVARIRTEVDAYQNALSIDEWGAQLMQCCYDFIVELDSLRNKTAD